MEASYGGLFKASGGFSKENGSKHLTEKSKGLKINFKVRKVVINRPWLEVGILKYPTIGINGLKKGSWSSGDLDAIKNDGQFPVLPTAMIVAKDVIISAKSFDSDIQESFSKLKTNASFSVVSALFCFSIVVINRHNIIIMPIIESLCIIIMELFGAEFQLFSAD